MSESDAESIVLSGDEATHIAEVLSSHFYDTRESAYETTSHRAAYLAMEIRDRAEIAPNPSLLDDDPEAADGFRRGTGVDCYINRPADVEGAEGDE